MLEEVAVVEGAVVVVTLEVDDDVPAVVLVAVEDAGAEEVDLWCTLTY